MKTLIDCDIIEYCLKTNEERQKILDDAADSVYKPVYALPMFELCRSLHLLVKLYGVEPNAFRCCWAELTEVHRQNGEFSIHIAEHPIDNPPRDILNLSYQLTDDTPCEDFESYWDGNRHLVQRMRWLHPRGELEGWWRANPPEGKLAHPDLKDLSDGGDLVIDSNNLLELLNQLPLEGMGIDIRVIRFPRRCRLTSNAVRHFKSIIESYGVAGHIIVPICVLEEVVWVSNKSANRGKYRRAREVLHAMSINLDLPLWNIFDFEPISQEIFDHFAYLYERLSTSAASRPRQGDFGDMLVMAFGLYHGCKIASNEWFEGKPDVWHAVRQIFPYMVLE
jgi:hypothetical protein